MNMIDAIQTISPVSEESLMKLQEIIEEQTYPRGHTLLNLWQVDRYFHFIVKGSGRVYYLKDGIDMTDYIALDGHFLGGVVSLFTGEPSHKAIELMEDSVVQSLHYPSFEELCLSYPDLERLFRKIAVFAFLECQQRVESIRFMTASERYAELEKKYPGISNRVPLKHIASYLGTTPVSLSRIRSGNQ